MPSAPIPQYELQADATGADLTANNTTSTGAAPTEGALEGDASGEASPHASAAQEAAGPADTASTEGQGVAHREPPETRVCTWPGVCTARTKYGLYKGDLRMLQD